MTVAIKLRNQLNRIIAYHLGENCHSHLNGELLVIEQVASRCHSFVDVGANIGNWSQLFLSNCQNIHGALLVEPGKIAYGSLMERFSHYDNIEILHAAMGSTSGLATFYEQENAGEHSSLLGECVSAGSSEKSVSITTLDCEIQKRGWVSIDFLKIDTEGFDYHVLAGANRLLSDGAIRIIQFEYNNSWAQANATLAGAFALLKRYGYSCFLIRSDGLYQLNYARYGEYYAYSNFLAVMPEWKEAIRGLIRGMI